jgi:hypothetical protein
VSVWHRKAMIQQNAGPVQSPSPAPAAPVQVASTVAPPVHVPTPIKNHALLHDHAQDVLEEVAATDLNAASDAWDLYHAAKTPEELATGLRALPIPPHIAARLVEAKESSKPKDVVDRIFGALVKIDPVTLDIVEKSPHVLAHFVKAALEKREE